MLPAFDAVWTARRGKPRKLCKFSASEPEEKLLDGISKGCREMLRLVNLFRP